MSWLTRRGGWVGWRRSIGNAVNVYSVPRVRIPSSPPRNDFNFDEKLKSLFFRLNQGFSAFLFLHKSVLEHSQWHIFVCFKKTYNTKRFLMAQKVFLWYKKISYDNAGLLYINHSACQRITYYRNIAVPFFWMKFHPHKLHEHCLNHLLLPLSLPNILRCLSLKCGLFSLFFLHF